MIIPTLHITDNESWIEFIDLAHLDDEPIITTSMTTTEDTVVMWYDLLTICMDNYDMGYDIGYNDAIEDMEGGEFDVEV
jgi:hypothetical protein